LHQRPIPCRCQSSSAGIYVSSLSLHLSPASRLYDLINSRSFLSLATVLSPDNNISLAQTAAAVFSSRSYNFFTTTGSNSWLKPNKYLSIYLSIYLSTVALFFIHELPESPSWISK
jgi:hypothetical protein